MRKLATVAISFAAAVFLADYLLPAGALWWIAGGFAAVGVGLLFLRRTKLRIVLLIALGLMAGCLCCALHAQFRIGPALALDGQELEISGELLDYPLISNEYSRAEIRLDGEGLPHGNVLLYTERNALSGAEPGDRISCTASFKRADIRYGERYDLYFSRDILLTASCKSSIQLDKSPNALARPAVKLKHLLCSVIEGIFPEDTAGFMKSLMLGDKTELYQDKGLHLAMSRAGCMHIVAVSGMHIAFLIGMIQMLFGKSWRSSILCIALVWGFVFMTGASPSALRAAIMQSFLLIAPMVQRENDPLTSLSIALALILAFNPWAATSVSLQLSFGAMAGILCLAEPLNEAMLGMLPEPWARRLRAPISTVSSSLAVMVFTVPLMMIHFRTIQILSPLTNVLALWSVSLCFCGGYISCFLAAVFTPLGVAAAWLTSWLARYIFLVSRLISAIPFAVVYIKERDLMPVLWVVLIYVLAGVAFYSKMELWKKLLLPTALAALTLALMNGVVRGIYRSGDGTVAVLDVGQGQCIAVMSGERTMVIDCGGLFTLENAGETAGAYLRSCGRDRIDLLLLTHLDADHCNGVTMLMEMLPVDRLILPAVGENEERYRGEILECAGDHGTQIEELSQDSVVSLDKIQTLVFVPEQAQDAGARCLMCQVSLGQFDMLVTGDAPKAMEKKLLETHLLGDMELLVVGHHGSRNASSGELLGSIGAKTAVISVGYNTYGHPTYETLERLRAYGYSIHRTDLNGTFELRVG